MGDNKCYCCDALIAAADLSDVYCYGCGEHICERCSMSTNMPLGSHCAEDHERISEGSREEHSITENRK